MVSGPGTHATFPSTGKEADLDRRELVRRPGHLPSGHSTEGAQSWSNIWPRWPQLRILSQQGEMLVKRADQPVALVGSFSATDRQQIFFHLAFHAIARHQLPSRNFSAS